MKKIMSIEKREKEMERWAAEPPGLTVKQIKNLCGRATNNQVMGGKYPHKLFAGPGIWSNTFMLFFEDAPKDVTEKHEVRKVITQAEGEKFAGACNEQVWPVEVQIFDGLDKPLVRFSDGKRDVTVNSLYLIALMSRAKDQNLSYFAQLPSGEGWQPTSLMVKNGRELGVIMGMEIKKDREPIATFGYRGE